MNSLVEHATRELALLGSDKETSDWMIEVVGKFAEYGHSGGSASWAIPVLHELLQFKPLTPLTDHPLQWKLVGEASWQSVRNPEAFSNDHGKTYYLLSEGASEANPQPLHESEHR